jgi:hypothetical protein
MLRISALHSSHTLLPLTCTHFMTQSRCRSARSPRQLHSRRSAAPFTNSSCIDAGTQVREKDERLAFATERRTASGSSLQASVPCCAHLLTPTKAACNADHFSGLLSPE